MGKTERRRTQLKFAARRSRQKKKDEAKIIDQRIKQVNSQLQLLAQCPEEECAALVIFASDEELTATIAQKQEAIHQLRRTNQRVAQQLRSAPLSTQTWSSRVSTIDSAMNSMSLSEPMLDVSIVFDVTDCQEIVAHAIQELTEFGPRPDVSTELVYNLGWKVKLRPVNACMHALGVQSCNLNVEHAMNATWELLTSASLEKFRNIFSDTCLLAVRAKTSFLAPSVR